MRLTSVAATLLLSSVAAADDSDDMSTISPESDTPEWLANDSLSLTLENSKTPGLHYPVLPLTQNMGLNGSSNVGLTMNIRGDMTLVGQSNYNQLSGPGRIAYLCCDDADKQDSFDISPNRMLNHLMGANLSAIVLYSAKTNWCSFSRGGGPAYSSIVTMADKGDATDVLAHIKDRAAAANANANANETAAAAALVVSITGNATGGSADGGGGGGGGPAKGGLGGGNSRSTVAMSVLYSITGLITLLFLAIIVTGTVRAHRHPERYGPRSGFGRRPRQSRAKGIARAVLDTLPIVKFGGNDEGAKPDPEMELDAAQQTTTTTTTTTNGGTNGRQQEEGGGGGVRQKQDEEQQQGEDGGQTHALAMGGLGGDGSHAEVVDGRETVEDGEGEKTGADNDAGATEGGGNVAVTATTTAKETTEATTTEVTTTEATTTETAAAESPSVRESTEQSNDHLGCSICTEDFTVGEDVRVLPCHHKFHPGCVDPWLVNVSGTCPLCRYDLAPNREDGDAVADTTTSELPPPLTLEVGDEHTLMTTTTTTTSSGRRQRGSSPMRIPEASRLGRLSSQERLAALREMRRRTEGVENERRGDGAGRGRGGGDGAEEVGRAGLMAAKLRDKFRIRTRAQT